MKRIYDILFIAFTIAFFVIIAEIMITGTRHEVRYDCRMAEISVDVPAQVKELCRKKK